VAFLNSIYGILPDHGVMKYTLPKGLDGTDNGGAEGPVQPVLAVRPGSEAEGSAPQGLSCVVPAKPATRGQNAA